MRVCVVCWCASGQDPTKTRAVKRETPTEFSQAHEEDRKNNLAQPKAARKRQGYLY
jgi:hypothetical protein